MVELTDFQKDVLDWFKNRNPYPFSYAREVGKTFNITPQKASGTLKGLENRGLLCGKAIEAGMNSVKIYFVPESVDDI